MLTSFINIIAYNLILLNNDISWYITSILFIAYCTLYKNNKKVLQYTYGDLMLNIIDRLNNFYMGS